jgi:oligopeptide transport system substrate-binding protein
VAQGLVRFDSAGEIEPALAQSWIVSDDGRRYTFRLRRTLWARGEAVTAKQVVARFQGAFARTSRNALKSALGSIEQVEAMTERVVEIRLKGPRPNFLQLLAQPELAVVSNNEGTGPYRLGDNVDGWLRLIPPPPEEDEASPEERPAEILLRGEGAAEAIARFAEGGVDLVTGGTLGDLPLLAAAGLPAGRLVYDPTAGLLGLAVVRNQGPLADRRFRHALAMAVDREAIAARFNVPTLQTRMSILHGGISELPISAAPDWSTLPLPARQETAARIVAEHTDVERPRVRVAMPPAPGYRILFAHLRRDWLAIGVEAVAVAPNAEADLRLIDTVAPANLAPWYLRHFMCEASPVCDAAADQALDAARLAQNQAERQGQLVQADRAIVAAGAYIPIGQPVRWSLRSERLTGFRANPFARHSATELIAQDD